MQCTGFIHESANAECYFGTMPNAFYQLWADRIAQVLIARDVHRTKKHIVDVAGENLCPHVRFLVSATSTNWSPRRTHHIDHV